MFTKQTVIDHYKNKAKTYDILAETSKSFSEANGYALKARISEQHAHYWEVHNS